MWSAGAEAGWASRPATPFWLGAERPVAYADGRFPTPRRQAHKRHANRLRPGSQSGVAGR